MTSTRTTRPAKKLVAKSATGKSTPAPAKKRPAPAKKPAVRPRGPNLSLLRRVRARILAHPERYDQSTFCGTAYCIAGHAIMEGGSEHQKREFRKEMRGEDTSQHIDKEAAKLLRLSPPESERLFSGGFPDEILEQVPWTEGTGSSKATRRFWAERGAARIDLFISSGGEK